MRTTWTRYILDPSGEAVGTAVADDVFTTLSPTQIDDGTGNLGLVVEQVAHGGLDDSTYAYGCTARFDPYGEPTGRSADGTNICNTGRTDSLRVYRGARRDPATGAYQFGARTYVPGRAGFLTPDNYQAAGTETNLGLSVDPLTRNSYAYVNGDPINLYDPTGHGWRDWKDRAVGIAKQVGGVFKGLGEALYETGKGVGQLAWAGVALTGARGNDTRVETWNQVRTTYQAVKSDPWGAGKAIVSSFADGIRGDWKYGNYGEAIGRGLFEALSSLAGGGIAAKMARFDLSSAARGARYLDNVAGGSPGVSASMPMSTRFMTMAVSELTSRQRATLDRLPSFGSNIIVRKRDFGQGDLVALTAATGDEFAMLTTGGRRMVIRGGIDSVPIDVERARELAGQGWRFSAHTHPGQRVIQTGSSPGDRAVLDAFGGEQSAIFNSVGLRGRFTPRGDLMQDWLPWQ